MKLWRAPDDVRTRRIAEWKCLLTCSLSIILMLLGSSVLRGREAVASWHIAVDGNDETGDGSGPESAWATLAYALEQAADGDIVHLGPGVYRLAAAVEVTKAVTVSGTAGAAATILDGRGANTCLIIRHTEAVVKDLTIRNGYGNPGGVLIEAGTLRRCLISGNITGSHVDHTFVGGIQATGAESRIEHSVIIGNRGGRWGAAGIFLDEGALLRNCLVVGNWTLGSNANSPGGIRAATGARIESCTVVGNHSPNAAGVGGIVAASGRVYLRNSIVYFNRGDAQDDLGGNGVFTNSTHNIVGNLARDLAAETNRIDDPQFVGPGAGFGAAHAAGDYRLFPGSPAIGAGLAEDWMTAAEDLDGQPRVVGAAVDIGAYEFPAEVLTAAFRVQPVSGFVGETEIAFHAGVAGHSREGLHYAWDFDNDGAIDREGQDQAEVLHSYEQAGLKTVRLIVRNAAGEEAETIVENAVRIGPPEIFLARDGQTPVFPYSTRETAADTLQAAVDAAVAGSVIQVGAGVYAPEATVIVDRAITIESVEGAAKTYFDGRGQVRCLRLHHPEAVLRGITISNDGADNVMDHGAVGDGETNDAPAIQRALAASMGGVLVFPPGVYRIDTSFEVTIADNLTLRGTPGESILRFSGDHNITFSAPLSGSTSLSADVARGDTVLPLEQLEGIEPGDLVNISDSTVRETAWKRPGAHISYVVQVDAESDTVEIAHPLNFDFTVEAKARVGFSRPRGKLWLQGLDLVVGAPERTWSQQMLSLSRLRGTELRHLRFLGVRRHGHNAMNISGCMDTTFRNLFFDNIVYGVTVGNSRNTFFEQIESFNSRHPVTPASWSDGIHVDGLRGDNNHGIMDAHPAFNIHYNNVHSGIEAGASNLRSVGGSIRNSTFIYREPIRWGPYFQTVALVNPEIYRDYEFVMENVLWEATRPISIGNGGTVILRHVRCVDLDGKEVGINVGRNVGRLLLENTKPGNIAVTDVEVSGENRLNAGQRQLAWTDGEGKQQQFEDGYVLDFQHNLLSRDRRQLRAHGQIFVGRTDEPLETKLRIYDTFTGQAAYPQNVYGILKLKAIMTHANAGGWQIVEQHYHFNHKRVQSRGLAFQTTPVYVSAPAGQLNATLEMTLANPRHDAPHAADTDRWFQVDIQMRSGRLRPEYRLYYEIELFGQ